MARPKSKFSKLTESEYEVMEIIWKNGEVSVRDVYEIMRKKKDVAYTTVMTVMGRLVAKKALKKTTDGKAHLYSPAVSKDQTKKKVVKQLLAQFFEGKPSKLVAHFMDEREKISPSELNEMKQIVKMLEEKGQK